MFWLNVKRDKLGNVSKFCHDFKGKLPIFYWNWGGGSCNQSKPTFGTSPKQFGILLFRRRVILSKSFIILTARVLWLWQLMTRLIADIWTAWCVAKHRCSRMTAIAVISPLKLDIRISSVDQRDTCGRKFLVSFRVELIVVCMLITNTAGARWKAGEEEQK